MIGVARTPVVPEPTESTSGGATILPGVPLPVWVRPEEPVAPEPVAEAPVPEPLPVLEPVPVAMAAAPVLTAPVPPPPAPPAPAPLPLPPVPLPSDIAPTTALQPPAAEPTPWDAAPPAPPAPWDVAPPAWDDASSESWAAPPVSEPVELPPPTGDPVILAPAPDVEDADDEPEADTGRSRHSARSRRPLALVGAAGGVVVLAAVAAFVWPGLLVSQDDSSGASVPSTAVAPVRVAAPTSLAGMTQLTGTQAGPLHTLAAGTALPGYSAPVSAVYGVAGTPAASVVVWTSTSRASAPDPTVALAGYALASGAAVPGVAPVPSGALGGRMSCGTGTASGSPATVCFWSDASAFGQVTVLHPASAAQGVATATAIRAGVETRG